MSNTNVTKTFVLRISGQMGVGELEEDVDAVVERDGFLRRRRGGRSGSRGFAALFDARQRHRRRQRFHGASQIIV